MDTTKNKHISKLSYNLPDERIAKYPLKIRDSSKLLLYKQGLVSKDRFSGIHKHLPDNSLLFFNNTKVIHARLKFKKLSGANIEIFCLSPELPADYQLVFSSTSSCIWLCLVGNLKKWKEEILEQNITINNKPVTLKAEKKEITAEGVIVQFTWDTTICFSELIETAGIIPIPPYLNRDSEPSDNDRYQTVYSKHDGSVAAPTAGLHFTPNVLSHLSKKGIEELEITLHVGAGTFRPVKVGNALEHKMHSEFFKLPVSIIEKLAQNKQEVIATGTTTMRCLESLYWLALSSVTEGKVSTLLNQWKYRDYKHTPPTSEVFQKFASLLKEQGITTYSAYTQIMIVPGYEFQVVSGLITNFHQPESTLLLLVAAFIGEEWEQIYNYALSNNFRFLSYGDSSLLWRK